MLYDFTNPPKIPEELVEAFKKGWEKRAKETPLGVTTPPGTRTRVGLADMFEKLDEMGYVITSRTDMAIEANEEYWRE